MKRLTIAAFALCLGFTTAAGCSSGNEEGCRKAIENIFRLTGLDKTSSGPSVRKAVRSCRANASKDAIECMVNAKTNADLQTCEGGVAGDLLENENKGE